MKINLNKDEASEKNNIQLKIEDLKLEKEDLKQKKQPKKDFNSTSKKTKLKIKRFNYTNSSSLYQNF